MNLKNKNVFKRILIYILIILLLIYVLRVTTIFDENYSLVLSNNNITNLIKLDTLDVHPPLYYLVLRIFLLLTTFWTKSFLIRIIFARILSVIISVTTFWFLIRIIKQLTTINKYDLLVEWILFIIIPGVISFTYEFIKIRMYSLGALFVVIELYSLIKYIKKFKNRYIILSTLMSVCAIYTNYYTAIISGLFLISYFLILLFKDRKYSKNVLISGIIVIVSFIPWIPSFLTQISHQSQHMQNGFLKQWLATLLFLLIFIYPLIWSYNHMSKIFVNVFTISFVIYLLLLIFVSVLSIADEPALQFRYFYPIDIIYSFLGINVLFNMIQDNSAVTKSYSLLCVIFLSICCIGGYCIQLKDYSIPSFQLINEFHNYCNKNFVVIGNNSKNANFNLEKVIYLYTVHKRVIGPNNLKWTQNNYSYKKLFYNINKNVK